MDTCVYRNTCPLLLIEAGYSPEFMRAMKERFCHADPRYCARFRASQLLGSGNVPRNLLPTEVELLVTFAV